MQGTYNAITHCKELYYSIYANQISDKQLQIHTANIPIFKSPSISSNRAVR